MTTFSEFVTSLARLRENIASSELETRDKSWDDYFIGVCSNKSKDSAGACIVNKDNKIVGIGYNGMPKGCSEDSPPDNKHFYECHAEMNAILLSSSDVKGCTLYVTQFPCNECVKIIIQSGIKRVIYLNDIHDVGVATVHTVAAEVMLACAKVEYRQHTALEVDAK